MAHKGDSCLQIYYPDKGFLGKKVSDFPGILWSSTRKVYYVVWQTYGQLQALKQYLKTQGFRVDDSALNSIKLTAQNLPAVVLNNQKQAVLAAFYDFLNGLRFSQSTQHTYGTFIKQYLGYLDDGPLETKGNDSVRQFIESTLKKRRLSVSTHRQLISAFKHFARFLPDCNIDELELVRPKQSRKLPLVLSKQEVIDLLRATKNIKHRAILALLYSSGLRVGELLNLELRDIDIDRRQVFVRNAKGRKDRVVQLAESFVPLLHNYYITYRPERFFAEGITPGCRYSAGSVRKFLRRSCNYAKINKPVTPHTLRHSYATHMLENGVDIRYIQELLGHARPETTMIYTHVSRQDLLDLKSPLDVALEQLARTDKNTLGVLLSRNI